jgi:carbonic anhydrase
MAEHDDRVPRVSSGEAVARLVAGNERFRRGESNWLGTHREVIGELAAGQHPFATIIGCSDSRVTPEIIFDAGLGELFVVRVAGNVLSGEVAGSIQYAGAHLRTPLFVVLGHEGCGAVQAALATRSAGARHRSRIQIVVDNILAGLGAVDPAEPPDVQLSRAVEQNVRWTVHQIAESPEARARAADGGFHLVGAIYDLASGRVRLLEGRQ